MNLSIRERIRDRNLFHKMYNYNFILLYFVHFNFYFLKFYVQYRRHPLFGTTFIKSYQYWIEFYNRVNIYD